ncbi:prepilin-type N-terminal cleavage/methylation domain-containing protein [Pseudoalteromonas sp. McH1-7]|uniref:PulJ/GspJ family protein n=1 Tax=unclassified Pseudoalteromonas TaxID=194690 RepID=UPI0015916CC0|nr:MULTISPECIES: prepilin-type N-terminal cleavage/methylation domain-containing protein [unclassified Pseudoalteromonas]NUZ10694.1 prepilin-type N-terminal cleavage/methylation domain-containing protein [Pseudoalteromonas sp. McH1-7]USD29057.1 prepilin-type N-terminal cleavage/methylation domain-containing protein [Pseudoalteromonas sp. SCSIO 43201]
MAVTRQSHLGFSLIELMIATTLLSLIMFSGYYAYSLFSDSWSKRSQQYWRGVNTSIGIEAFIRTVESINAHVLINEDGEESALFEGTRNKVIFVSNSPIFSDSLALVSFEVLPVSNEYALIYSELPLDKVGLYNWPTKDFHWTNRVTLIKKSKQLEFSYFSYSNFKEALESINVYENNLLIPAPEMQWLSEINTKKHRVLPAKINLRLTDTEQKETYITVDLPNDSASKVVWNMRQEF